MVVGVFLNLVVEYLIISALTPLVSAALPLLELVDGVVEFLHRERLHCVLVLLVLVLVFVFLCLRRRRAELLVELCEHVHNVLSVICVAASFILHVCDEDFLASGFDRCFVLESAAIAQDVCDAVSSLFVFDRAYLVLDHFACVMSRLSVFVLCCVAFFECVVVVIRRDRCS